MKKLLLMGIIFLCSKGLFAQCNVSTLTPAGTFSFTNYLPGCPNGCPITICITVGGICDPYDAFNYTPANNCWTIPACTGRTDLPYYSGTCGTPDGYNCNIITNVTIIMGTSQETHSFSWDPLTQDFCTQAGTWVVHDCNNVLETINFKDVGYGPVMYVKP